MNTSLNPKVLGVVVVAALLFCSDLQFLSGALMGAVMYHTIAAWKKAQQ